MRKKSQQVTENVTISVAAMNPAIEAASQRAALSVYTVEEDDDWDLSSEDESDADSELDDDSDLEFEPRASSAPSITQNKKIIEDHFGSDVPEESAQYNSAEPVGKFEDHFPAPAIDDSGFILVDPNIIASAPAPWRIQVLASNLYNTGRTTYDSILLARENYNNFNDFCNTNAASINMAYSALQAALAIPMTYALYTSLFNYSLAVPAFVITVATAAYEVSADSNTDYRLTKKVAGSSLFLLTSVSSFLNGKHTLINSFCATAISSRGFASSLQYKLLVGSVAFSAIALCALGMNPVVSVAAQPFVSLGLQLAYSAYISLQNDSGASVQKHLSDSISNFGDNFLSYAYGNIKKICNIFPKVNLESEYEFVEHADIPQARGNRLVEAVSLLPAIKEKGQLALEAYKRTCFYINKGKQFAPAVIALGIVSAVYYNFAFSLALAGVCAVVSNRFPEATKQAMGASIFAITTFAAFNGSGVLAGIATMALFSSALKDVSTENYLLSQLPAFIQDKLDFNLILPAAIAFSIALFTANPIAMISQISHPATVAAFMLLNSALTPTLSALYDGNAVGDRVKCHFVSCVKDFGDRIFNHVAAQADDIVKAITV